MFEDRIETFVSHLAEDRSLSEAARELALEQLGLFHETEQFLIAAGDPPSFMASTSTLGETVLDGLRRALSPASDENVLSWVKETARGIRAHFESIQVEFPEMQEQHTKFLMNRARTLSHQASVLQDQASLRSETVKLNAELQDSAAKAKDAAGIIGTSSLATHFGSYANDEAKLADRFRSFALAGFLAALVFALVFGNGAKGAFFTFENEWTALAFKAAGALGIGGIAAYLARQSGQHRRMANWARSMEVQLQSFPAFIEPLEYEQQAEMYSLLARRVLTAPPEKAGGASEDSVGAAQLIDILTSVMKRSSPPGS